MAYINRERDFI